MDTSVIVKWFHQSGEQAVDAAMLLREAYLKGALDVVMPDLLVYEFANALRFKARLNRTDVAEMVQGLWSLGFAIMPIDGERSSQAVDLAYQYNLTIYDATFVALAQELPATFITADEALYGRIKDLEGVLLLEDLIK